MTITKLSDFCIDSDGFALSTISTYRIICIVSKDEIKHVFPDSKQESVLISITEPNSEFIDSEIISRWHDALQIQFWDVTDESTEELKLQGKEFTVEPLTHQQGKTIKDFILKHADKKFAVHCHAGISRSAGVAEAIICLLEYDGDVYNFRTSENPIKKHWRYYPNKTVFDRILAG
jgi:predicted protein tyrosine phosphatase